MPKCEVCERETDSIKAVKVKGAVEDDPRFAGEYIYACAICRMDLRTNEYRQHLAELERVGWKLGQQ